MSWDIIGVILVSLIGIALIVRGLLYNRASKKNSHGYFPDVGDSSILGFILSILFGLIFLILWGKIPWWMNKILLLIFGSGLIWIAIVLFQGKL